MDKVSGNDQDDFEVYPSPRAAVTDFTQAFASLRQALKPADAKLYSHSEESYEDFILRLALNVTNSKAVLFRKNDSAEETKVLAWLSIVSEKSKAFLLQRSLPHFDSLSMANLRNIAKLSLRPENVYQLIDILAQFYGIVFIVEPGFRGMKMDGCTFKLPQGTPVVGISIRYNRYDNFWFTLMHELAHICLHYDLLDQPILDDLDEGSTSEIEAEANIVAKDSLVSRQHWRLIWNARANKNQLFLLCRQAEIHPAIAAGMLRHQSKNYKLYPGLHHTMDMRRAFGFAND